MQNKYTGAASGAKQPTHIKTTPLALAMAALTASCAMAEKSTMAPAAAPNIVDVKVYFEGSCPKYVDNWDITVGSTPPQKVRWTAYNLDGSSTKTDVDYDIYFDPFAGADAGNTKKDGTVTSRPFSPNAPVGVTYKYTILATGCSEGLDPLIRVL